MEPLAQAIEPAEQIQADQAFDLTYTRQDGSVERANDIEEAMRRCPFLGSMSLEEAEVFLSLLPHHETSADVQDLEVEVPAEPEPVPIKIKEQEDQDHAETPSAAQTVAVESVVFSETVEQPLQINPEPIVMELLPIQAEQQELAIIANQEQQVIYERELAAATYREPMDIQAHAETTQVELQVSAVVDLPRVNEKIAEIVAPFEQAVRMQLRPEEFIPDSTAEGIDSGEPESEVQATAQPLHTSHEVQASQTEPQADPAYEQEIDAALGADMLDAQAVTVETINDFDVEDTTFVGELAELFEEQATDPAYEADVLDQAEYHAAEQEQDTNEYELEAVILEFPAVFARQEPELAQAVEALHEQIELILKATIKDPEAPLQITPELTKVLVEVLERLGVESPQEVLRVYAKTHTAEDLIELLQVDALDLAKLSDFQHYLLRVLNQSLQDTSSLTNPLGKFLLSLVRLANPVAKQAA